MDFFKGKLAKLKVTTAQAISTASKVVAEQTSGMLKDVKTSLIGQSELKASLQEQKTLLRLYHPTTADDFLTKVCDQVYQMVFPEESMRVRYGELLREAYTVNYRIWNVSEYSYDYRCFNDQVSEHVSVGYPNPPLVDLFLVCKEIEAWTSLSPANVAIVHCQKSKTRSALVLSCLLYYKGQYNHPGEALSDVCKVIRIPESQVMEACTSVYANYFALLYSNLKLNSRKLRLQKIVVSEIPSTSWRIDQQLGHSISDGVQETVPLRPYLQIFQQNKLVYSSLTKA